MWQRLEGRFVPFGTTVIFENPRTAARMMLAVSAGAGANLAIVTVWLAAFKETRGALASAITSVLFLGIAVRFFVTGRGRRLMVLTLWLGVANNLATHVVLGGYSWSGVWLGWGAVITATSALFLGRRHAVLLAGTYVVLATGLAFAESSLREARTAPEPGVSAFLAADMFIASLLMLTLLTNLLVEQVTKEHERANSLLLNVFPRPIVDRLKGSTNIIADRFERCAVLFADIAGFTSHSHEKTPEAVVAELNEIFSRFDGLVEDFGVEKIKTIGDGYMAVAGVPVETDDGVAAICSLALAMREEITNANSALGTNFGVRIGLHVGEAVAGVIGQSRFSYDLWGDTVNIASRMESQGEAGLIQATGAIRTGAPDRFQFEPAGVVAVKGIGDMEVFHLTGVASESSREL